MFNSKITLPTFECGPIDLDGNAKFPKLIYTHDGATKIGTVLSVDIESTSYGLVPEIEVGVRILAEREYIKEASEDGQNAFGKILSHFLNDTFNLGFYKKEEDMNKSFAVKKIIYSYPATIVFWEDGTKTIVKCSQDDEYSEYYGFLAALAKKVYGNPTRVRKIIERYADIDDHERRK